MRSTSGCPIVPAYAGLVRGLAALAVVLVLSSCGREDLPTVPPQIEGPPRWHITQDSASDSGFTLQVRDPCRVRLRLEATKRTVRAGRWRDVAAGQTLAVRWSYARLPDRAAEDRPPAEDAAVGRTESAGALVDCHFEDRATNQRTFVFWGRPGKGRLLHLDALPPGRYEDLPAKGSVELLTVFWTDLATGKARLKRREQRTRLILPETLAEGDHYEGIRIFLDIAPTSNP